MGAGIPEVRARTGKDVVLIDIEAIVEDEAANTALFGRLDAVLTTRTR